jgi:hypothetical protein
MKSRALVADPAARIETWTAGRSRELDSNLICAVVAESCANAFEPQLRALILIGSLAREEGTFVPMESGTVLLGDAEFLLLFHDQFALPAADCVAGLESAVQACLRREGLQAEVELSPCHSRYLRSLEPHVFAYEIKACGRIVWGDPDVLSLVPTFSSEQIPREDAWRLLCNRLVELLEPLAALKWPCSSPPPEVRYRTVKLYLDMATSFLLFAGAYAPTYRERAQALRRLAAREGPLVDCPLPLVAFASRVEACTRYKLHATGGEELDSWASWGEAIEQAHALWRWELARLTGASESASEQELGERWRRRQPPRARLRGWLYVLRNRGWHRSWRQWGRWVRLGVRSSPRHCVYSAGTKLVFALSGRLRGENPSDLDCAELTSSLPVRMRPTDRAGGRAPWQDAAHDVSLNYREFLVGTRS